jgi:hypothetical protein
MARARERVRLEDGLKLDLNRLIRNGCAQPGESRRSCISWKYMATDETSASGTIEMHLRREGYGTTALNLGELGQIISLGAVPRHFGGPQWYFLCPALEQKVSVLWLPPSEPLSEPSILGPPGRLRLTIRGLELSSAKPRAGHPISAGWETVLTARWLSAR